MNVLAKLEWKRNDQRGLPAKTDAGRGSGMSLHPEVRFRRVNGFSHQTQTGTLKEELQKWKNVVHLYLVVVAHAAQCR
jgi:hypothetical protein